MRLAARLPAIEHEPMGEGLDTREADEARWARHKRLAAIALLASLGVLSCVVGALFVLAGSR